MRAIVAVLGGICLVGCERKAKEPRYEGPMPITFGDCAGADIAWVSGPRPAPFTAEQAAPVWIEDRATGADSTKTAASEPPVDPPPPSPPSPPPPSRDEKAAQEARRQALEQAREAGVLGSTTNGGAFASLTGTTEIDQGAFASLIEPIGDPVGEGNGGYGLKDVGIGFGAGGIGTSGLGNGWGTLGTGRYGTIGYGSGYGTIGIGRSRATNGPTVSIAAPATTGNLDKEVIRRYVRRNIQKITYCYEKQLLVKPSLAGTIDAEFFISPAGDVASSSAKGFDDEVASCIAAVIKGLGFPKPKGGGGVLVKYPFRFVPAGNDTAGSGSSSGSDSGSAVASSGSGSAGSDAPANAPGPHASRRLYRETGPVDRTYLPGTANPLRVEQTAFEECFRTGMKHHGTAVVELAYDETGKTTNATVHGIEEERVKTCVAKVAKRVKRVGSDAAGQRCSVAYGEMPSSELPALDITADAVVFGGKKVSTMEAVVKDTAFVSSIPGLHDAIIERVRAAGAVQAVVSAYGPLVVRPVATSKMKVVTRVLRAIVEAGDDFVLATQSGAEWHLVEPLALPVVPVPFGTGAVWNHMKVASSAFGDDATSMISLLVAPAQVTIFQTAHDKMEIPHDQLAKVADELRVRKAAAGYQGRSDIEIATTDDATYDDFLAVVKMAISAGFTDWQLTSPSSLLGER